MSVFILEHLSKSYFVGKKEHKILDDLNLTFSDNGLVSIVGKSGCGKSTLLNLLMGIEKPTKGKILFKQKDISKFKDKKFSKFHLETVSLIFQHYNLFNFMTAEENVSLPLIMCGYSKHVIKKRVNELFQRFKIERLQKQKVGKMSGGEKQRIAILRSLIIRPKAILCDEPTGALDTKNSEEIMGILKEISKNTLVIMVSHNKKLVNKYSDQILHLEGGKIIEEKSIVKGSFTSQFSMNNLRYKSKWINKFFYNNLRKDFGKNIFSIIACSVCFASMFLSVGFSIGSKQSQDEALRNNLSIGTATVSKTEIVEIEGSPLNFQKIVRPDLELVDLKFEDFSTILCEENTSYLISSHPVVVFDDLTIDDFQMIPVYDLELENYGKDLIIEGGNAKNDFDSLIINKEFAKLFSKDILNKKIVLKNTSTITYQTKDEENPFIKETFSYEKEFKICGIVNEFPFLNTPKVYFSYQGGKNYLKSKVMENVSNYLGKNYSFYQYLVDCKDDDPATNYSSYIFLKDLSEFDKFSKRVEELLGTDLEITSSVMEIRDTYSTFISSFSSALVIFVAIAFIGINCILGMISLSTFIQNKKDTAILTCLGAQNSSIHNLYLGENVLIVTISFVFSVLVSVLLQNKLNPLIYKKFSLANLICIPFKEFCGIPFGLIFLLYAISILCTIVFTLFPMIFYRQTSLADELRDE